jgi:putative hydrolase of the HAD superfamily
VALRMGFQAVFFDLGYTLVYFEPEQEAVAAGALKEIGIDCSPAEILAAVRVVFDDHYRDAETATFPATPEHDRRVQTELERRLLGQLGVQPDPETLARYSAALHARYDRPGAICPYPEVEQVLEALREQGYRLGIVSNWSWNLRTRVAQAGLERFFELVWGSAYAGCHKPHPAIFRQALGQFPPPALSPDRVLYVGDSYWHDVVGAHSAGLAAALLDRPGTAAPPDCPVIHDLWGVLSLL